MSSMIASVVLSVLPLLTRVVGYSFEIVSLPIQCGLLTLQITEGMGIPPYEALIIPYGPQPGTTEQRRVILHQFSGNIASLILPYPANSHFVVMLSDSKGIGTGGTSIPTIVGGSDDNSCLPSIVPRLFSFNVNPTNTVWQCAETFIFHDGNSLGNITITLVIPGGESTNIPTTNSTDNPKLAAVWIANVRLGAELIFVAGDARGPGTGGTVQANYIDDNFNSSCLNDQSLSSTAGTPAGAVKTVGGDVVTTVGGVITTVVVGVVTTVASGGVASTARSGNDNGRSGGRSGSQLGGILGGVIGAVVVLAISSNIYFCLRGRRHRAAHGVDLLSAGSYHDPDQSSDSFLPEPFFNPLLLPAEAESMADTGPERCGALSMTDSREKIHDSSEGTGSGILAGNSNTWYPPGSSQRSVMESPQLRPVSFVQHEDAGEAPEAGGQSSEREVVELPPSYTSVWK